MSDAVLGYCGLFCGGCRTYQRSQSGNPECTDEGVPLICDGCNSGRTTIWCTDCEIKKCSREKGLRYCLDCEKNPCEIMTKFMNDEKYPYHQEVQDNMKSLKKIGLNAWIVTMTAKYTCSKCNSLRNWFENECPNCSTR